LGLAGKQLMVVDKSMNHMFEDEDDDNKYNKQWEGYVDESDKKEEDGLTKDGNVMKS
jgi:hypothetical protein